MPEVPAETGKFSQLPNHAFAVQRLGEGARAKRASKALEVGLA